MGSNMFISRTAFTLFVLAVVIVVLGLFAPILEQIGLPVSGAIVWVISVLALLSAALGFMAFKTALGKIASIGGVLLLLAVLFLVPTASTVIR